MNRPPIPRPLEREVLVEAGHRCAIPTCRQTPVEIAHIIPWTQVKEHTFDNLIAICPTCHARYDKGEIDRKAMLQYKGNLSVLNGRYGDLERRVLRYFAEEPNENEVWLPGLFSILLMYLLEDGLLEDTGRESGRVLIKTDEPGLKQSTSPYTKLYRLTSKGREFINRWISAQELN